MRYAMVIDLKRCIGCYGCQIFCKAEHATPRGVQWSRVLLYESGSYPAVQKMAVPVLCRHCAVPACVDVCPTGASRKRADGIVTVEDKKCTGCLNCLAVCPYGARQLSPEQGEYFPGQGLTPYEKSDRPERREGGVGKCDFCLARTEQGRKPVCVENCMTGARYFGDLDDPESDVAQLLRRREVFPVCPGTLGVAEEGEVAVYYLARS